MQIYKYVLRRCTCIFVIYIFNYNFKEIKPKVENNPTQNYFSFKLSTYNNGNHGNILSRTNKSNYRIRIEFDLLKVKKKIIHLIANC